MKHTQDIIETADNLIELYQECIDSENTYGTFYLQQIASAQHEKNAAILSQLEEEENSK